MTAYDEVIAWATTRPWWQQQVLGRLANGEVLGEDDYEEIAESLFRDPPTPPDGGWFASAAPQTESKDEPVRLLSIKDVVNVNRLAADQELTFEPDGLTVVYGNNGSGKSGYARVIQSMVRTRHRADILPDVFADAPGQKSGKVTFVVGQTELAASLGSPAQPTLGRVAFYDEHCGDTYLNAEAEISYRPSAVQLVDDLTEVCGGVRRVIDKWRSEKGQAGPLPEVDDLGAGGTFLRDLSSQTTDEAIAAATACAPDAEQRLEQQVQNVARLRTTDPTRETQNLRRTADALDIIVEHLASLAQSLGTPARERLASLQGRVTLTQEAADAASGSTFGEEPLAGIGSPVWRVLWKAAEDYSKTVYPESEFPHTGDLAVCVLCQQSLDHKAADRLTRFHEFVSDTTARDAEQAQQDLARFQTDLGRRVVAPQAVAAAISTVEQAPGELSVSVQALLERFRDRQAAMVAGDEPSHVEISTEVTACETWARSLREQAASVDATDFAERLAQAEAKEQQLRDQIAMRDGRDLIEAERARLRTLDSLKAKFSEANARSITEKAGELTRTYVTEEARDRFTRETDRLGLERVTFKATKARQGALLHKADFLNARTGARLGDVLSEGEQTALGFAGFLTEAHFDTSKSALVFDDPVSSLDHMLRAAVAERIVALAEERQVIVFTHDVAFTMVLRKAAREASVPFATRGVERRRKVGPGFTTLDHPWTAQDAAQRVETLRQEVAALRRNEKGMPEAEYLRATENVAGHMSQTWERIISQVLAEPLVDYKSLEVRVGKLRVIGRVTGEDVKTYDDSYSRISGWASRHDPHPELNYTPPSIDVLSDEIEVLDAWLKRVRKYQN